MQHSGKNGASAATSVKRTSSQAWLPELDASATASNHSAGSVAATKMSLRLKLATRLHTHRVMGAEPYQVGRFHLAECAGLAFSSIADVSEMICYTFADSANV